MPIHTKIDHEKRIVYNSVTGVITRHDFDVHHNTTGMDASLFGYDEIFDLTGADDWDVMNIDFVKTARRANALPAVDPKANIAVICNTFKSRGIVKFYIYLKRIIRTPSRTIHVFNCVSKAESWLESLSEKECVQ